jgi:hypothetical protein
VAVVVIVTLAVVVILVMKVLVVVEVVIRNVFTVTSDNNTKLEFHPMINCARF